MPIMNGYHGSTWTQLYKIIEVFQEPSIIIDFFRSVQNVCFFLPFSPFPKAYIMNVDPKISLIFFQKREPRGGVYLPYCTPILHPTASSFLPSFVLFFLIYSLPPLLPSVIPFLFTLLFFFLFFSPKLQLRPS